MLSVDISTRRRRGNDKGTEIDDPVQIVTIVNYKISKLVSKLFHVVNQFLYV